MRLNGFCYRLWKCVGDVDAVSELKYFICSCRCLKGVAVAWTYIRIDRCLYTSSSLSKLKLQSHTRYLPATLRHAISEMPELKITAAYRQHPNSIAPSHYSLDCFPCPTVQAIKRHRVVCIHSSRNVDFHALDIIPSTHTPLFIPPIRSNQE